jgi:hypothetical protein
MFNMDCLDIYFAAKKEILTPLVQQRLEPP